MKYDILFLGKLFPKETEKEIKSKMKTGMQDAANALQWNIIDGLDQNNCGTIKILDYLPVDSYPNGYTDSKIDEYAFQHTKKYNSDDLVVGCTNLTIIKQFANLYPFKCKVKEWCLNKGKNKVLIIYTANPMFLTLARYAKKLNKNILTCCIIADIPEFSSAKTLQGIRRLYNNYIKKKTDKLYKYINKFVLLTDQMAKKLNISVPYTVIEGIAPSVNVETDNSIAKTFSNDKYIFYSGTLNYEFGIGTLLDAFSKINDKNLKLVICGFGAAEKDIITSNDKRICYLGRIDRSQALALQTHATVLVNPRQNTEEFTKYSFPSKTMEYLSSGVPVVAYKLDGIPNEYDNYITYVPDNTSKTLAKTIESICALSAEKRKDMGTKAKNFVLKEKNNIVQAKKIIDMINNSEKKS